VKRGDTLGKIAERLRPSSVSLDQALVSLFRENPDAFVDSNMNRLKAGTSLRVPAVEAMAAVDAQEARREISLQAADWQAYRAKLAERVAEQPAQEETAGKTAIGKITPRVEDQAQPKTEDAKDVLKLSKAAPVAPSAADLSAAEKAAQEKALAEQKAQAEREDMAAREKALQESNARAAELEKQIQDMQKLSEMKEQEAGAAAEGTQPPPAAAAPQVKKTPPPVVDEPQANWYDDLLENPIYWIGGLSVVVLGGLLWWMVAGGRLRRSKAAETVSDSIITGGDLQPTGMAGAAATGGVVNTGDTSFLTDFSQAGLAEIDTHDVDPIAEADVYMAYGRDAQAEEILKEALTKTPDRHEIRLKLLEIYAARKNVTSFEAVAGELYAALGGNTGAIWDKAVEMGRSIDPHNPLYGGTGMMPADTDTAPFSAPDEAVAVPETQPMQFSESEPESESLAEPEKAQPEPEEAREPVLAFSSEPPTEEFEFDLPELEAEDKTEASAPGKAKQDPSLDFDLSGFDLNIPEESASLEAPKAPAMDFSGLDLDLGDAAEEEAFDEVATKLDLARAYLEMGDKEGAREILQEVINEGNDRQQGDARNIMAGL